MRIFWWHCVCLLLRYEGNDGRGSDDGMMSGWRLYILGWKVRGVCFIFVCQFVSLSVRQFLFSFVSSSVRAACRWRGYAFCSAKYIFPGGRVMCSSYRASVCEKIAQALWFLFIVWIIYLNGLFLAPILPACLFFDDPFWWADFRPRFTDELTNWRTDN